MKQLLLFIVKVLIMGVSTMAANKDDINQKTRRSFQRDFSYAHNISFEKKPHYVKVTFSINEQVFCAYYNNSGELQAVVRNILSTQLPLSLLLELKKGYGQFWISELFEITAEQQTIYYVTLENADKTIVLKSEGISNWTFFSRTKKEM
jgi:hypothetical protein